LKFTENRATSVLYSRTFTEVAVVPDITITKAFELLNNHDDFLAAVQLGGLVTYLHSLFSGSDGPLRLPKWSLKASNLVEVSTIVKAKLDEATGTSTTDKVAVFNAIVAKRSSCRKRVVGEKAREAF